MRLALLPLLLCAAACGGAPAPRSTPRAAAPSAHAAPAAPDDWTTTLDRDHPLVGRIWDVAHRRFVTRDELEAALAIARFALLGEKHDNPDHHRLQAAMIGAIVRRGRHPAVALEMLDLDDQARADEAVREHPRDVEAFFQAVAWDHKGWPPAREYAPIVRVALEHGLPIVAANLPARDTRALVHGGLAAMDPAVVARLGLEAPLPEALAASLRAELAGSHCGMLPEAMLAPMALAQRARDAEMADRLIHAAGVDGAVLVAGSGHARRDRGVPREIARRGQEGLVSVTFAEVDREVVDPARYGAVWQADAPPFDYLWFTPRATDQDPCEGMKRGK